MEVLGPKGPFRHAGSEMLDWARNQLLVAEQIMDNPGGGLLFATTAVGQVKASLSESDRDLWQPVVELLDHVEDHMVRRRYDSARAGIQQVLDRLTAGEERQPA
jgi:hypothetical protein